jgi:tetratricopeptide (TPR) repeat protein
MKRTRRIPALLAMAIVSLLYPMQRLRAQQPPEESSSKPAEPPPAPPPKPSAKPNKDSPTQPAPDQPTWDPLRAEKDLEVGQYYMRRGDYDAAIDRFSDAIEAKPGYAVPFKFLGEAQEKKKLRKQAIKSYTRYLELFPSAEDGDKIRKKIDKLWSEVGEKKKSPS